ncbi:MAG: hypothetical protein FWE05_06445 [Defluviitaleaceae bacterium]|nr:hypothetical protein [Defluviitaleaceae bacterium]
MKRMPYQLNKSHLLICIIAALVITAGFVIHHLLGLPFGLFTMALWISLVIVGFYIVGHVARAILINSVFAPTETAELIDDGIPLETDMNFEEDIPAPEGVMAYVPIQENQEQFINHYEDSENVEEEELNTNEPTADELMESLAMGDIS